MSKLKGNIPLSVLLMSCIAACVALVTIVVSYAYRTDGEYSTNRITVGSVSEPRILEDFENGDLIKSNVRVEMQEGAGDYYIRSAVILTLCDADGNILPQTPAEDVDYEIEYNTDDWTLLDNGYWYYNHVISAGDVTENLINYCETLNSDYQLVVDVMAQSILLRPTGYAEREWGAVFQEDGWTSR